LLSWHVEAALALSTICLTFSLEFSALDVLSLGNLTAFFGKCLAPKPEFEIERSSVHLELFGD
jgi:hypothetical protein